MTTTEPHAVVMDALATLASPVLDPASRTWWPGLLVCAAVMVLAGAGGTLRERLGAHLWRTPSARLDLQLLLLQQTLDLLGMLPRLGAAAVLATAVARGMRATFGAGPSLAWGPVAAASYALTCFVAFDASRYALHRALHTVPALWRIHRVHHEAEVLTPLTFHRVHPLEAVLYGARGVAVAGVLGGVAFWPWAGEATATTLVGVDALGLLLNVTLGNLRHSHVWIRFPSALERWFLSPAQHQLHHAADPVGGRSNHGVWLAAWDRMAGTLRTSGEMPPTRFGTSDGASHRLLDALAAPLRARSTP